MAIQGIQSMIGSQLLEVGMTRSLLQGTSSPTNYATSKKSFSFMDALSDVNKDVELPQDVNSDSYCNYLKEKFGVRVTVKYFKNDQASMDKLGGSMCGNDVVIAPNILEQMVNNREKAAYYEQKIQNYFDNIPKYKAECAAMGLTYEPCGVAIHEDGTVYYIGGGTETPERKAKIIAAQRAKEAKKLKHWQEQQEYNKWLMEHKRIIAKIASDNAMLDMLTQNNMMLSSPAL